MKAHVQAIRHSVYTVFDSLLAAHRQGTCLSYRRGARKTDTMLYSTEKYGVGIYQLIYQDVRRGERSKESHALVFDGQGYPLGI